MSRSGYSGDTDDLWALIRWRGAVASALRGKRGQLFLKEILQALDALPQQELISWDLEAKGSFCTLGAVGRKRGIKMPKECDDNYSIAELFQVPLALASEIMYENDEAGPYNETPAERFKRIRRWIVSLIKEAQPSDPSA